MKTTGYIKLLSTVSVVLIGLLLNACGSMYYGYQEPKTTTESNNDGKCYGKCEIPSRDTVYHYSAEYIAFTGDKNKENVQLDVRKIELRPKTTRWVKRKADRNCIGTDPEDCLVWCLVEMQPVIKYVSELRDTIQTKKYEVRRVVHMDSVSIGGYTEWREILCQKDLNVDIISKIQIVLISKGYAAGTVHDIKQEEELKMDFETKTALRKYQKDNKLPMGNLNIETLGECSNNCVFINLRHGKKRKTRI